jgi:hypothetical protein
MIERVGYVQYVVIPLFLVYPCVKINKEHEHLFKKGNIFFFEMGLTLASASVDVHNLLLNI